mgnify:CR=1 FL=1
MLNDFVLRRLYGSLSRMTPGTLQGYHAAVRLPGTADYVYAILAAWNTDLAELERELKMLDDYLAIVTRADEPTVLPEGSFGMLQGISAQKFRSFNGEERVLLTPDEVRLLSIRKGSLDDAERLQIESHVVHTFNFLQQIPWTREIRTVPEIARGHHEKLNGVGYPRKGAAPETPETSHMESPLKLPTHTPTV